MPGTLQTHSADLAVNLAFPTPYQITDSESHADWSNRGRLDRKREEKTLYESLYTGVSSSFNQGDPEDQNAYDVGGDFFSEKLTVEIVNPSSQRLKGKETSGQFANWNAIYDGPVVVPAPSASAVPTITNSNLVTLGATAIARCSPTNNVAAAANMLHELRTEGLPKLFGMSFAKERVRRARDLARSGSEEYLNKEYGWDPLVGDIKAIAFAVANAHTILQQYERDSGRVVRRRYAFPEETTSSVTAMNVADATIGNYATGVFNPVNSGGDPVTILRVGASSSTLYRQRQTKRNVWFSGAFTYHLPTGYNARNRMIESARKAQTLLGLDLTPEILWNAAPWTWAVDWFSNAGDVVANLSDWGTDGLVMKYGYVMEHVIVQDTYFVDKLGRFKTTPTAQPSPVVVTLERKRRLKASPFGFGLTWYGLSPRQIAISVALGLTKGIKRV